MGPMFFEAIRCVPGVWDADVAEWKWGVGDPPDPDGSLLAEVEEDLGWDPEVLTEFVVADDDAVFDSELQELLVECELALDAAARDEDLALVGGESR